MTAAATKIEKMNAILMGPIHCPGRPDYLAFDLYID
jgi:hypothetical protein